MDDDQKERIEVMMKDYEIVKNYSGSTVVEIRANRRFCDPSLLPMLKLILEAVKGVGDSIHQSEPAS